MNMRQVCRKHICRPILEYGNVIWDSCTQNEANLLESLQVEAGRIITGLRVNSSRSKLYSELGWEPLYKRREKQKLILLYKIINGLTPAYMYDMIQPYTENIHDYNLRQQISGDTHLTVYDIFFSVTYMKIFRRGFCTRVQSCLKYIKRTGLCWGRQIISES
jgi:hypothetical protein